MAPDNAPASYVKLIMLGVEEPGVSVIKGILSFIQEFNQR